MAQKIIDSDEHERTMDNDIYLGYRGGSGGFILLHLLLCSGDFYVNFGNERSFDDVIDSQWQISTPSAWKNTEVWPDNEKTIWAPNILPRIYFFCNPTADAYFKQSQHKILTAYQRVKDLSWPEIQDFEAYKNLPFHIREECEIQHKLAPLIRYYARPKKFVWIYTDIHSQNELAFYKKCYWYYGKSTMPKIESHAFASYRNQQVDMSALPFLEQCDTVLRLQDIILDPEILVHKGLIKSVNQQQEKLISKWLSLHPPGLLKKIGIAGSLVKT